MRHISASGGSTITGPVYITDTTASTGCSLGALVVAGGVGIGGNLNVCGQERIFNTTAKHWIVHQEHS